MNKNSLGAVAVLSALTVLLTASESSADVIDNPSNDLFFYMADSYSPFLTFADSTETYQSDSYFELYTQSDGTFGVIDAHTTSSATGEMVGGFGLNAQLIVDLANGPGITGSIDGANETFDWTIEAYVKFTTPLNPGTVGSTCRTPNFYIDIAGDYGSTDTFTSDSFTIPAITSGCGTATNRTTINTALALGSDGATLLFPKISWDPEAPYGS
jgi:hypothetical protein